MCNSKTEYQVELVPRRALNFISVYADCDEDAREIVEKLIENGQIMNLVEGLHSDENYEIGKIT